MSIYALSLFCVHTVRILSFHGDSISIRNQLTLRKVRCVGGGFGGICFHHFQASGGIFCNPVLCMFSCPFEIWVDLVGW